MAFGDVVSRINEDYPFFGFLLTDPEIGPLLTRAVDPATPYSQTRFMSELMKTTWYRSRSAAAREWEILINTDPAEAWKRRASTYYEQSDIAHKLGYMLTKEELEFMTEWNLGRGIEVGSAEWNWGLRTILNNQAGSPGRLVNGAIMGAMNDLHSMANGQYFVNLSQDEYYRMGVDRAMGYMDEAAVRYGLQERASSMYPHLRDELDKGYTMQDLFSGHMQTIGQEWDMDPSAITYDMPIMQHMISMRDPTTGTTRAGSLYEAKIGARTDQRFWNTQRGQQYDASITNALLNRFGARA